MSDSEDWDVSRPKVMAKKLAEQAALKVAKAKATKIVKPKAAKAIKSKAVLKERAGDNAVGSEAGVEGSSSTRLPAVSKAKTVDEIYQKKTQLEHILIRPDTYIGSVEAQTSAMWVYENEKFVWRNVTYVPGLYKIFDEIIVNAADNKVRDSTMDTIRVTISRENNTISVYNNGRGIPVEMHSKEKVYVPELIFGHLLTSSNYDDNEKKTTGGRNGYGAKLCNIFSTEFIVETADSVTGRKFVQVHSDNMSKKGEPKITSNPKGENYTRITFKPDLAKFGMIAIDDDFEALVKKRTLDMAGCVRGVKVFLNDTRVKVKDFKDYAEMYIASATSEGAAPKPNVIYERVNDRWEIAFTVSDGQFQQVSFVNSICTTKGGTHVNHVADQLVTSLIEAVKKKDKKGVPLKPFQAKNHLWVFVNCSIENPAFDSQTKENMTLRQSAFGSKCGVTDDFMKKVMKSGVVENILSFARFKQDQLLKKTDGAKRTRITGLAKLDDANNAGTKNGSKCTLILTEGDSAKSLAVAGLSVIGRDNFGVFPLRGKLLNVREASHSQITANAEINAIKQIMGLQHGKQYTTVDSLRYGHLMIMTDQDHDGSHIKGLIINLIDHFWPTLLKIPGFLLEFITPIIKVTKGTGPNKKEQTFFTIPEYEEWKEDNQNGKGWTIKYYKGLGTSTTEDCKKYFSTMQRHLKPFSPIQDEERALVDMAFSKKKADDRKEWLREFEPGTYMDHDQAQIPITDFINRELILFSMADNARSIPSAVDGLKPGQRKTLFSCFKRKLKGEIKVAQLAGYVSEHSAYHHGEASLASTIVGLAQNFVGSNNLPLLEPLGQFGTRLQGGKDAASARYIFTALTPLTRALYHPSDDALLSYQNEDGQMIEPEWYLPILPMLLLNGGEGIGTGWSTSIPNYNPRDIVDNIFRMMDDRELIDMQPWYRGFRGTIESIGKDKFRVTGCIEKIDDTTVEITELPIRCWTQSYKEDLEAWLTGTEKQAAWIKDYREYHTEAAVKFIVTMSEEQMALAEKEGLEKRFKLISSISTSNLVCFDQQGRIRKYDTIEEIFREFYHLRREFYQKRKAHILDELNYELTKLDNKVRFVLEIIAGKLVVQNKKKDALLKELQTRDYKPFFKREKGTPAGEDEAEETEVDTKDHGFDYLLSMPIWNLTMEKVESLKKQQNEKNLEVTVLTGKSVNDLWKTDLDAFLAQWDHFEMTLAKSDATQPVNGTTVGQPKRKPVVKQTALKLKKEADMSDDDEDADFAPSAKAPADAAKPKAKPVAKPRAAAKPRATAATPKASTSSIVSSPSSIDRLTQGLSAIDLTKSPGAVKKRVLKGKKTAVAGPAPTEKKPLRSEAPANATEDASPSNDVFDPMDVDASPRPSTAAKPVPRRVLSGARKPVEKKEALKRTTKPVAATTKPKPKPRKVVSESEAEETDGLNSDDMDVPTSHVAASSSVPVGRTTRGKAPVKYVDEASDAEETYVESESDFADDD